MSPAEQIVLEAPPDVSTAVLECDEASTSLLNPSHQSSSVPAGPRVLFELDPLRDQRWKAFVRTIRRQVPFTKAKTNGQEEFDMGRSNFDNPGLIIFKDRWGAQRRTINYWHYPAGSASSRRDSLIKHAKRMISIMPGKPLVMIGNLLYRHIG